MSFQLCDSRYKELFNRLPHLSDLLECLSKYTIAEISIFFQSPTKVGMSSVAQKVLYDMVSTVFDVSIATALVHQLQRTSRIISTHHLGIDCLPELVQSVHFCEIHKFLQPSDTLSVIPIIACSGVSLQSCTYSRGMMLSGHPLHKNSYRFPLFVNALKRATVYTAPKFTKSSIMHMAQQWKREDIPLLYWDTMHYILDEIILHDDCLNKKTLTQQFMYINEKMYQKIYHDNPNAHVVSINIEEFARGLVMHDMQNTNSILYTLFFTPELRQRLFTALCNERGCWSTDIMQGKSVECEDGGGTAFFWAIDKERRRRPLSFVEKGKDSYLVYKDIVIPFTPDAIVQQLESKNIYCSIFTALVSLHLEHFVLCYGGLFHSGYLPIMLDVVRKLLEEQPVFQKNMDSCPPFAGLGSGVISVQSRNPENHHISPAGSIELLAHGGLSRTQLTEISQIPVSDLLPLAMQEWLNVYLGQDLSNDCGTWRGLVLGD